MDSALFTESPDRKLAVVTGGTGMLGSAIASRLGAAGMDVALVGTDIEELDRISLSLGSNVRSLAVRSDFADETDVVRLVEFVERLDRPVDVLVHAAGIQAPSTIAWSSVSGLDDHYLWNVRGPYLLTQRLLPLLALGGGRVVFFKATATKEPSSGGDVHHRVSAAAMAALADELRVEAFRMGIRVVSVNASLGRADESIASLNSSLSGDLAESIAAAVATALSDDLSSVTELGLERWSGTSGARD